MKEREMFVITQCTDAFTHCASSSQRVVHTNATAIYTTRIAKRIN